MQHGWVRVPIRSSASAPVSPYVVEDLLDEARYTWHGDWNYVKLDPGGARSRTSSSCRTRDSDR